MLFCISFVLLQHACNDDLHLHNEKESISSQYAEIETAKLWFEHNKIEASTRMVIARGNKGVYFPFIDDEPSWSFYAINRNDSLTVVDIDITDRVHQDYVTEENFETYRKNRQWQYRRSYSRFVHVTNHQTGKQKGFFMTIIPSRYYVKTYNKRIRRNTYLNRDKYLGGYVLFHNFEGQFVNGWEYKGGKIIHRIVPAGKGTSGAEKEKLKLSILPADYTVSPRLYTPISTRSGFEDDDIIDGGWFDDVIITPDDPDPDWPDPDWPDWPELDDPEDWDDGDIWGDWDDYDDWESGSDPLIPSIQQNSTLTSSQQAKLEEALQKLIREGCMQQALYDALVSENVKLDFGMKTGTAPAAYDPNSKKITFNDYANISSETLKEELFHAWQDAFYADGISQYLSVGKVNIEFEAKFFKDLLDNPEIYNGCCYAFGPDALPQHLYNEYIEWIYDIRDSGNMSFQDNDYQKWLNYFQEYNIEYTSTMHPALSQPSALRGLIDNSTCTN